MSLESAANWEILSVASGAEAIEVAAAEILDAILLDVMMPGMDGPQTLKQLRNQPNTRETPVLFLTAKIRIGDAEAVAQLGAQGVIFKPFDPLTLADRVAEALGWLSKEAAGA